MAFISALVGDFTFLFIITHYIFGILAACILWSRYRGWLAKLIMFLCVFFPFPLLLTGAIAGVFFSNKYVRGVTDKLAELAKETVEAAVVVGATIATIEVGGVGGLASGGAVAALEGAEVAGTAAAEGAAVLGEGATALTEGAQITGQAAAEGGVEAATGAAEGAGETAAEGSGQNQRPSEKITDQFKDQAKEKIKEKIREGLGTEGEEERDRKEEKQKDYEEMMQTEAEKDPIEVAATEEFKEVPVFPEKAQDEESEDIGDPSRKVVDMNKYLQNRATKMRNINEKFIEPQASAPQDQARKPANTIEIRKAT
jgi:hypothetical protein